MLVANHASFMDVIILLATLPVTVRFAAKARLATYPMLGTIIRRAGYLEVTRGTAAAADDLVATLRDGESLFVFPEGTFVRVPGVMPFRLGAFHAAVEMNRPVLPIALVGTRACWPDERWLLTHGSVQLVVGNIAGPEDHGMVRDRQVARRGSCVDCPRVWRTHGRSPSADHQLGVTTLRLDRAIALYEGQGYSRNSSYTSGITRLKASGSPALHALSNSVTVPRSPASGNRVTVKGWPASVYAHT